MKTATLHRSLKNSPQRGLITTLCKNY